MKTMVYSLLIVAVTYVCQRVNSASVSDTSGSPPDCSTYKIDSAVLHVTPPEPKAKSAIGKIFASLHGELNATLVPQPSGPSCYEWDCQSHERLGQKCRWCLPSIFIGGIAKCGTTALCDKLVSHPSVRFYRNKETDLFTKFHFSIAEFEKKINTEYITSSINISTDSADSDHNNNPLNKRALKKNHQQMRAATKYVDDSRHVGNVWLDCSAGAFRDFNAAAHLRKYSPDTKVVMIVRDPWQVNQIQYISDFDFKLYILFVILNQTIGSRMAQQTRNGGVKFQTAIRQTSSQFKKIQYPPEERFGEVALRHVTAGTDYTYAEKLLHWVAAFPEPDKLLMVDQYNLQVINTMIYLMTYILYTTHPITHFPALCSSTSMFWHG